MISKILLISLGIIHLYHNFISSTNTDTVFSVSVNTDYWTDTDINLQCIANLNFMNTLFISCVPRFLELEIL